MQYKPMIRRPSFERLVSFSLLAAALTIGVSCSDDAEPAKELPAQMKRADVAKNLARSVALPQIRRCADNLAMLSQEVEAWRDDPSDELRAKAQEAWEVAYLSWQRCEVLQLGPAGTMDATVGGEGLRFEVYTYPQLSECFVDQELVTEEWRGLDSYIDLASSKRGLGALEYLLFYAGLDNQCSDQNVINSNGTWDEISEETLTQRRAEYAAFLATGAAAAAESVASAWETEGGGFVEELATAGSGSQRFSSAQQALNEFSNAMVYFEKEVKDMKLASPLGVSTTSNFSDCDADACPELRESRWANLSLAAISENLAQFEELYFGAEGDGFDDLLREIGAAEVADEMEDHLRTARVAFDAIDGALVDALVNDREDVAAFYVESQEIVSLFKTQFVNVLALELPNRAAADND